MEREHILICRNTVQCRATQGIRMTSKHGSTRMISKSASPAPIISVRSVPSIERLLLFVRAGGRCEFDGCNRYLIAHPLTLTEGNFGQVAHIVAFRPDGPRGQIGIRPQNIHNAGNLMLLCPQCHKLIDDHPDHYTKRTLIEYKRRHEKWIRRVTSLGPDRKTALIIVKSPIGKQTISIPFDHMLEAVTPRYPISREGLEIDLTNLLEESDTVTQAAQENIARRLARFFEPGGEWQQAGHVSLFALAPMPVLVFLGTQLSNKVPLVFLSAAPEHRELDMEKIRETARVRLSNRQNRNRSQSRRTLALFERFRTA